MDCYLTCPRGLEEITANQIDQFCNSVTTCFGGVEFSGNLKSLYSINLYVRTGMHALIKIMEFNVNDNTDLYNNVTNYSWFKWIDHCITIHLDRA